MLIILKFAMWSGVLLNWIKHLVNNILLSLYLQVQEQLKGKKTPEWVISVCVSNQYKPLQRLQNQYKEYQWYQYF